MENIVLIVHLLLALALIAVVLLQRSEGGGLGMGGGGGAMTGRAAASPLGRVTWLLAIAFIATSMTLTIFAASRTENASVVDRLMDVPARPAPALPAGEDLLPPGLGTGVGSDAPLVPRAAD